MNAQEKKWCDAIHALEFCALCHAYGVQWAHRDYGKGMGLKTQPWMTAPLCPKCHSELTDGKQYSREEKRAFMDRAIVETHDALIRSGKLRIV